MDTSQLTFTFITILLHYRHNTSKSNIYELAERNVFFERFVHNYLCYILFNIFIRVNQRISLKLPVSPVRRNERKDGSVTPNQWKALTLEQEPNPVTLVHRYTVNGHEMKRTGQAGLTRHFASKTRLTYVSRC